MTQPHPNPAPLLAAGGFAFLHAEQTRDWLAAHGSLADWPAFAASWHGMRLDEYMADGGRYRRRRYAVFNAAPGGAILRGPHEPHFQTTDYNRLNGGVERWFEPMPEAVAGSASLGT
ncbi:MAG: 2OG-Fe dioxygenase family protein, partial [Rhodospirillales bacterium]|nr:2OG-Fe dioxygenase family protein [Rhodospirillales bacterium]